MAVSAPAGTNEALLNINLGCWEVEFASFVSFPSLLLSVSLVLSSVLGVTDSLPSGLLGSLYTMVCLEIEQDRPFHTPDSVRCYQYRHPKSWSPLPLVRHRPQKRRISTTIRSWLHPNSSDPYLIPTRVRHGILFEYRHYRRSTDKTLENGHTAWWRPSLRLARLNISSSYVPLVTKR